MLLGGDVTDWLTALNEIPALEAAVTYFDELARTKVLPVSGIAIGETLELLLATLTVAFAAKFAFAVEEATTDVGTSLRASTAVELAHGLALLLFLTDDDDDDDGDDEGGAC